MSSLGGKVKKRHSHTNNFKLGFGIQNMFYIHPTKEKNLK